MPISDKSPHLGILRSTTSQKTQDATVEQNITKSRRAAYSLMSAGMHGENGLDPSTAIQLFKTFVQPILTYGLEVILPTSKNLLKLETFQKKILKQILSVPISAPDPSVYIMSGILPIEAQIDQKSLNLFNNICNQNENHLEKKIARRQLIAKNQERKCHTLLSIGNTSDPTREAVRISVKLKVITDTYILQSHRSRYNLNETPTCKLCDTDIEDRSHFLLTCKILQCIRERYLNQIDEIISDFLNFRMRDIPTDDQLQIILDCTVLLSRYTNDNTVLQRIEDLSRQLIYALHVARYRTLDIKKR
ncbi:Hypothetical predicted protein [Mytilus galloprovincialis]|uniref:Reverse transcriptase zinc-binding domain-containing protein n=1 Tax=Mytilus galloprovincialis TaxID=29158 RepID=A0A8B6F916_MYTGA|nr:Hypothetical predicted protein [Mytilus galloprovincialis]